MILRLMGEHVDQEQFDICPSPLFGVKRVAPDVRKFVERGVVILGAKLNNLVVKICLAILMMVLPAATSRDVVMECQNFQRYSLLFAHRVDQPNDRKPTSPFPIVHLLGEPDLKPEVIIFALHCYS